YRDIIVLILQTIGVDAQVVPSDLSSKPALYVIGFPMTIGRGCIAMEAGACILALITITNAPLKDKLKGGLTFVVILFVANILRLTTNFVLISWGFPFWLAHDTLNKLFALVGIVIASFILEKQGIPIINEVANWMEVCLLKIRNTD
ncbi:MAG: exosortase/archaeosortase family protein, partial [Candidatus Hermodarchaeota archaeon]